MLNANMETRLLLAYLLLSVAASSIGLAQSDARVDLPQATLTAGDSFDSTVSFDTPSPCATHVELSIVGKQDPEKIIYAEGEIGDGQKATKVPVQVPRDFPAGDYIFAKEGTLWPCPGYSIRRKFSVPERVLTVKALPDTKVYPTKVDLTLTVNQKQFLDTKATQLSALSSKLDTEVESPPAEPPLLGKFLIGIVDNAEDALTETEKQYRERILRPGEKTPAFFADFHAQYQSLRANLKVTSPNPGTTATGLFPAPKLYSVQLKDRPEGELATNARSPEVTAVWQTIKDNIAAYLFVKNNNRITFNAQIKSFPAGARIRYRKIIDSVYSDYSSPTDVPHAEFELATWEFKFEKSGCKDAVRHIDPYQETEPVDISAELLHCKAK